MYKIEIDWGFRSPTLGILTGEVRIGKISMGKLDHEEFTSFSVKKERNVLGYSGGSAIFTRSKPLVDTMVRAYYDGMLMSNNSYEWFRDCSRHNNDVILHMLD